MSFSSDGGGGSVSPVILKVGGSSYVQIFPTSYTAKANCALLGSPSERGTTIYDNKVVKPTEIDFTGIVKYAHRNVITSIIRHLKKTRTLAALMCSLRTKAGNYDHMILEVCEEKGTSQRYDGMEIHVRMKEYLEE